MKDHNLDDRQSLEWIALKPEDSKDKRLTESGFYWSLAKFKGYVTFYNKKKKINTYSF